MRATSMFSVIIENGRESPFNHIGTLEVDVAYREDEDAHEEVNSAE